MKYLWVTLLILLLLGLGNLFAQNCTNYFTGKEVYTILEQDSLIWIGTECRIVQVDKNYVQDNFLNIDDRQICNIYRDFALDSLGNLWVGSDGDGLFRFDGQQWTVFNTTNSPIPSDYVYWPRVSPQGDLWFYSAQNLIKYDGIIFTLDSIPPYLTGMFAMEMDTSGNIWMLNVEDGLVKFDGTTYSEFNTFNTNLKSDFLTYLKIDKQNQVWVGGSKVNSDWTDYEYFIARLDSSEFVHIDSTNGLPQIGEVNAIDFDQDHKIWLATEGGLIEYYDSIGTIHSLGLPQYYEGVRTVKVLSSQDVIVGTSYFGARVYQDTVWNSINTANSGLTGRTVKGVEMEDSGILHLILQHSESFGGSVTNHAYIQFDGTNWEVYDANNIDEELPQGGDGLLVGGDNRIYVASGGKIYVRKNGEWHDRQSNLGWGKISLAEESPVDLIAGTWHRGLKRLHYFQWSRIFPFNSPSIRDVKIDQLGNIWFCTMFSIYKMSPDTLIEYDCNNSYLPCGLSPSSLYIDGATIYVGGNQGLLVINPDSTWSKHSINAINTLDMDESGNLWVGTRFGLYQYKDSTWIRYYEENSDILSNYINDIVASDTNVWLATADGLVDFRFCGGDTFPASLLALSRDREFNQRQIISVAPNPWHESTRLTFDNKKNQEYSVSLFDMHGNLVRKWVGIKTDHLVIYRENLSTGIYFLKLEDENGNLYSIKTLLD